jgi:hypothetical protein
LVARCLFGEAAFLERQGKAFGWHQVTMRYSDAMALGRAVLNLSAKQAMIITGCAVAGSCALTFRAA